MELKEAIKHWKNNLDKWKKDRPDLSNTEIVEEIDYDYNAIETILNHLAKQDKMNELMIEYLNFYGVEDDICTAELSKDCNENCKECIKQYFEKKAEEDSKCMK